MTEFIDTTRKHGNCRDIEQEARERMAQVARERIAPSRFEWLHSLKPGDYVASIWRSHNYETFLLEQIKEIVIYDPSAHSRISVQLEDGYKLDSIWISPVSAIKK